MKRTALAMAVFALTVLVSTGNSAFAVTLVNPGFDLQDASGGDIFGSTGWGTFNSAFTTQGVPANSAPNSLKVFGPFFQFGGAGVVQGGFAASEGELWEASAYARIDSSDPMNAANLAVVKLEFLDSLNAVIGFAESPQITTGSLPVNTWQQFVAQGTAPAGTTTAQIVLVHVQLADPVAGGSIFFDDAALSVVPEPATFAMLGLALVGVAGLRRRRVK